MKHAAFVEEYHRTINGFRLVVTQAAQPISPEEREAAYQAALRFVDWIEPDGWRLRGHWRDRMGKLLETLDEVVSAILDNNLA